MHTDYRTRPIVQIEHMVKEFPTGDGVFRALDDVSLQVDQGEMVAIMGPSGSGKSTLMTLIGLLDTPTSGRYVLDGEDVGSLTRLEQSRVRNRKLGFVFQNFNLLPRLTALQNVELPLVYGRVDGRRRRELARAALEAVGLGAKVDNLPTPSRAARSSASPSPAPWSTTRRSSSPTNPPAPSTLAPAPRLWPSSVS